jgi:hypothetical protein
MEGHNRIGRSKIGRSSSLMLKILDIPTRGTEECLDALGVIACSCRCRAAECVLFSFGLASLRQARSGLRRRTTRPRASSSCLPSYLSCSNLPLPHHTLLLVFKPHKYFSYLLINPYIFNFFPSDTERCSSRDQNTVSSHRSSMLRPS